ncbi:sensor histidine kinase [Dictyobacter formicarum]|uniref:histidine kinase n=1 Tax=Dictyobacter formicarum TaxID=2778368 RepID=A0ABQ3VW34_9CHLR|nr:PAS domain-containing sensor histidine kinase [Dictyobacter formicarum]GHO89251.1 hypothetical protein KSZ_72570 [Dictyobacter formicarum]
MGQVGSNGLPPAPLALLHDSQQAFFDMMIAEVGLWLWNKDSMTITVLNERMATFLNLPEVQSITLESFFQDVHPDDYHRAWQTFNQAIMGQCEWSFELRLAREGRPQLWLSFQSQAVFNEQGEMIRLLGLAHDITIQREVEERQAKELKALRFLLENMTLGLLHFDTNWRCTYINQQAEKVFHLNIEHVRGKYISEVMQLLQSDTHLNETEIVSIARWTIKTQLPNDFEFFYVPLQRWLKAQFYPKDDGLMLCFIDITRSRQTEQALRAREVKFRRLADANVIGIIVCNVHGEIIEANNMFLNMLGYTHDDVMLEKLNWVTLTPPEYLDADFQALEQLKTSGVFPPYEKEFLTCSGERIQVALTGAALDEQAETCIAYVMDKTPQKELERHRAILMSILGHELRTPLTAISGTLQLVQRRVNRYKLKHQDLPEDVERLLRIFSEAVELSIRHTHIQNRLIHDMLDTASLSLDKLRLNMQPCDFARVITEVAEDFQVIYPGQEIILRMPGKEVMVVADPDRLSQVIANYLSNALKYTQPNKPIVIELMVDSDEARCLVIDQGPGISLEDQQRVWLPFKRAKDVKDWSGSGTNLGLGLYICRVLMELQRGSVGVESIPNHGATFWASIPLAKEQI